MNDYGLSAEQMRDIYFQQLTEAKEVIMAQTRLIQHLECELRVLQRVTERSYVL